MLNTARPYGLSWYAAGDWSDRRVGQEDGQVRVSLGEISWRDFATGMAERSGFDPARIATPRPEERPLNRALTSGRGVLLPPLESAMERFFRDSEVDWTVGDPFSLAAE